VATSDTVGSFSVYYSVGDGTFLRAMPEGAIYQDYLRGNRPDSAGNEGAELIAGDFDGDGRADIVSRGAYLRIPTAVYYSDRGAASLDHLVRARGGFRA
jgi:hypothetical protein